MLLSAADERLEEREARFLEAAKTAGIGHLVKFSAIGAHPAATFTIGRQHGRSERLIMDSAVPFTFTIRTLIDYNEWATARLLTAAAQLDEDELRRARPGAGHGSIWGQLHHIALSQIGLHLACLGKVDSPMRARQVIAESGRFDLETPGGLWRAFEISHADLRELRDALTPEMLARPFSSEPRLRDVSLGDLVLQLLTHTAHHRGETAMLLSGDGSARIQSPLRLGGALSSRPFPRPARP